jgi:hypothetical protein
MRKAALCFGLLLGCIVFASSSGHSGNAATNTNNISQFSDRNTEMFSHEEWEIIKTLSPLPDLPVVFISSTMMVMMTANTPSLKASMRPLVILPTPFLV